MPLKQSTLSLFFALAMSLTLLAQTAPGELNSGLKSKDSRVISSYFDSQLHLEINAVSGVYSHVQAEQILARFFEEHPGMEYTALHSGSTEKTQTFCLGQYTEGDHIYTVSYKLVLSQGRSKIQSLSIREK